MERHVFVIHGSKTVLNSNDHKISTWHRKKSQFEAYCSLCDSTFSVANRVNDQQHSGEKKHSAIANLRLDKIS